jgi:hypothetical protein
MPLFRVTTCWTVWKINHFEIEAADRDEAARKFNEMENSDDFEWPEEPDNIDGDGWEIVSVDPITPSNPAR